MQSGGFFPACVAVAVVAVATLLTVSCGDDPTSTDEVPSLTVVSTTPTANEENVPTSVIITATFSQNLDSNTVTSSTFFVEPAIPGNLSYSGTTATFVPAPGSLDLNSVYQVTLTSGIRSVEGANLASNYAWVFRTEADSVENLVERYEIALNSHDTSLVGALMLDNFLHNGRDKACYLDYLRQSFVRYPAATFSLDLIAKTAELDNAMLVLRVTTFDAGLIMPYTDTVTAARVNSRWYLKGNTEYFSPRIVMVRYSYNDQYLASTVVEDNGDRAVLMQFTGTGFPVYLTMVMTGGDCATGRYWGGQPLNLAGDPPSPLPLTYSFLVTTLFGTELLNCSSSDYFGEYAAPIFPIQTDAISGPFTFVWHPIPGYQTINYGIRLGNGWEKYTDFEDTTLVYDGPALTGDSAHYYLIARPRGQSAYSARSVYFQIQ